MTARTKPSVSVKRANRGEAAGGADGDELGPRGHRVDVRGVLLHGRVKGARHSHRDLHRLLVNVFPRAIPVVESAAASCAAHGRCSRHRDAPGRFQKPRAQRPHPDHRVPARRHLQHPSRVRRPSVGEQFEHAELALRSRDVRGDPARTRAFACSRERRRRRRWERGEELERRHPRPLHRGGPRHRLAELGITEG